MPLLGDGDRDKPGMLLMLLLSRGSEFLQAADEKKLSTNSSEIVRRQVKWYGNCF
jgi:hypothetical protein